MGVYKYPVIKGAEDDRIEEIERFELLSKSSSTPIKNGSPIRLDIVIQKPSKDEEALEPFLKFFKGRDFVKEGKEDKEVPQGTSKEKNDVGIMNEKETKVNVEYYDAKPKDFVGVVVVSSNMISLMLMLG